MSNSKGNHISNVKNICLTALFVAVVVVCSQISFPLGPIPITLQTFAIIISAGILGEKWGTAVSVVYLALGCIGLPVFSMFQGGYGVILGATGGFLIGFVPMSFLIGLFCKDGGGFLRIFSFSLLGLVVCYFVGVVFYANVYLDGSLPSYRGAILACVVPFLIPDILKVTLSALVIKRVKKLGR